MESRQFVSDRHGSRCADRETNRERESCGNCGWQPQHLNFFTKSHKHGVAPRTVIGAQREVTCISSTATGEEEIVELVQSPMGWLEYDVFILFCSHSQEVRVSVGWGSAGSRIDTIVVPSEHWPRDDMALTPYAEVHCPEYFSCHPERNHLFDEYGQQALTDTSIEALGKDQVPVEAIEVLMTSR